MAGDLFSISHLDDVRHVDAGLWYRLGLIATEKKDTKNVPFKHQKLPKKSSRIN
jgi:hypothetical protein